MVIGAWVWGNGLMALVEALGSIARVCIPEVHCVLCALEDRRPLSMAVTVWPLLSPARYRYVPMTGQ